MIDDWSIVSFKSMRPYYGLYHPLGITLNGPRETRLPTPPGRVPFYVASADRRDYTKFIRDSFPTVKFDATARILFITEHDYALIRLAAP